MAERRDVVSEDDVLQWVVEAARAADEKLGAETVVLDVGSVLAVTGWFVITAGANARQVKAIADFVEQRVAEVGGPKPRSVEGASGREWVLLDFGDFVVHVFEKTQRAHYDLERLWKDVPVVDWR